MSKKWFSSEITNPESEIKRGSQDTFLIAANFIFQVSKNANNLPTTKRNNIETNKVVFWYDKEKRWHHILGLGKLKGS